MFIVAVETLTVIKTVTWNLICALNLHHNVQIDLHRPKSSAEAYTCSYLKMYLPVETMHTSDLDWLLGGDSDCQSLCNVHRHVLCPLLWDKWLQTVILWVRSTQTCISSSVSLSVADKCKLLSSSASADLTAVFCISSFVSCLFLLCNNARNVRRWSVFISSYQLQSPRLSEHKQAGKVTMGWELA